jgi:transcriptional regulator with GAF, ATPase, and Fis domain
MTRERRVVEAFVELADTMVDDFDVVEFLHRLALRCVELLDCAEVGLLLADPSGRLQVMASSSERADALELLQCQGAEGPCTECYASARAVFSEDLAEDFGRWPSFAPAAVSKGFYSVQALPMRVRGQTIGALNLFRTERGRLAEEDMPLGQGMADIASVALLQERAVSDSHVLVAQLEGALGSRVIIEQAKGILAEQAQIGLDTAFVRLRGHARAGNLRLADVARQLTDGQLSAATLE